MKTRSTQSGATLVISLIMLVVLTLLVVSAIRTGSTNLRIVGNMQIQAETAAAGQQAIEAMISGDTGDFMANPIEQSITVDMGPVSYTVAMAAPVCNDTVPLTNNELNPNNENDLLCFADQEALPVIDKDGKQIFTSAKCNTQAWELRAEVSDGNTGAKTTVVQGISRRTYLPTAC